MTTEMPFAGDNLPKQVTCPVPLPSGQYFTEGQCTVQDPEFTKKLGIDPTICQRFGHCFLARLATVQIETRCEEATAYYDDDRQTW